MHFCNGTMKLELPFCETSLSMEVNAASRFERNSAAQILELRLRMSKQKFLMLAWEGSEGSW